VDTASEYASYYVRFVSGGCNVKVLTPKPPVSLQVELATNGRPLFRSWKHEEWIWGFMLSPELPTAKTPLGLEDVQIMEDASTSGFDFDPQTGQLRRKDTAGFVVRTGAKEKP
jgi:hypothetical protein